MSRSHKVWKQTKSILTWLFFIAVLVLLVLYARKVDWGDVWNVIRDYNRTAFFSAVALVVVSYLIYGVYDLIGRAWCRHRLAKRQVMLVSFICYAFNLTLSTWVGGVAMRYRLYSRLGLPGKTITRIFSMSIATNWLGYLLVAGTIFAAGLVPVPRHWYIGDGTLQIIGAGLLLASALFLGLCACSPRRSWKVRGHKLSLPSLPMALFQFAISSANWMVMGTIIWILMGQQVAWPVILGVLLVSSIAGVIIHIPAGIGVMEAVFLALLSGESVTQGTIIAALLAWRVLYFILPLLLALVLYLCLESRATSLRTRHPHDAGG
ncbi:YbhN family protein [Pantoea sp. 1.19]|uniref:lysylphosphatidylglycerol synthase transmembrane domain-containing protein n=1 Tax=Pantoea sp. 1.19 TaxID=1925589 RepID=UPI000948DA56|nr:YbhN family protein [Pantoea sp. 1.19]